MVDKKFKVLILSDSLGETANAVYTTAKLQFPFVRDKDIDIIKCPFVNTREDIDKIIDSLNDESCVIIFTLVIPEMRNYLVARCEEKNIRYADLMTPVIKGLGALFDESPIAMSGIDRNIGSDYLKKIEAMEFAVKYDDGKNLEGLKLADLVLIGISRSSKTPLSIYFASKNIKVCNLPIAPEIEVPRELYEVDVKKVVGLIVDVQKTAYIRRERLKTMGFSAQSYYSGTERIEKEIEYAKKLFKELGCFVIDMTDRSIEEAALMIQSRIGGLNS